MNFYDFALTILNDPSKATFAVIIVMVVGFTLVDIARAIWSKK